VVEPRNPEKMAEAILRLFHDNQLSETLIKNGLKTPQKHNWEITADKVENYFLVLMEKNK